MALLQSLEKLENYCNPLASNVCLVVLSVLAKVKHIIWLCLPYAHCIVFQFKINY